MVAAGFEATVAPLGTALTEDQLGLLWRMQSEPILCFDGDTAGQRAAFRAVDLAMPLLKPGQSLRFAILPEGQDPDDLVRAGGAEGMKEVLSSARPLAEMLWLRETENARLDTPERRAALETRLADITRTIQDETVRRYYREDLKARLSRLLAPAEVRAVARAPLEFRRGPRNRMPEPKPSLSARGGQLATSSIIRGHHSGIPAREALILLAVLAHPWLLAEHAEEFVELEFIHRDAEALRKAILAAAASGHAQDAETLKSRLEESGNAELRTRMERAISHKADWPVGAGAAREDVLAWWHQIARLHRKKRTLSRELREAEHAYSADMSDANFARLKDIQDQLANLDGTEALIEGFGEPSGRPARTM